MKPATELQAANVRATAKAFSVPVRHVYRAIAAGELHTFGTGAGKRRLIIFDDMRAWLRSNPPPSRLKITNGGSHD